MSGPPMLRGSSLCDWLYTLVLSLLNGVVGGGLIALALCYKSFSTPTHQIGIVLRMCLVAGTVMVVFVFFWIIYIFCIWRASGQITQERQSRKEQATATTSRSSSGFTSLLGLLSLILLTVSIMVDLSVTGLMWWTSLQLSDQFKVRGDCFCERGTGTGQGREVRNIFNVNCPVVEGFVCEAVYGAAMVTMRSVTVSTTECQRLDGSQQDPVCLEYLTFWNLFKVLRMALPVLALVKLPFLLGNCSRWLCKERKKKSSQGKFATDSVSWIGLDVLISPLKLVDPVQFYSVFCTPLDSQPPLGERLGPIGQEHDNEGSLPTKPTVIGHSMVIANTTKASKFIPPLRVVNGPVPPCSLVNEESQSSRDGMTNDDSPPDIEEHTISTPKHPRLQTPSFDLSKVVKPVYLNTSPEAKVPQTMLYLDPGVIRQNRLSSFSSAQDFRVPPPPPLPKPKLQPSTSLHPPPLRPKPNIVELQPSSSRHPPPPFSRSTTTLPRPVRISSTGANSNLPSQSVHDPTISNQLSPPGTPTVHLAADYSSDCDNIDSVQSASSLVRLQPKPSHLLKSSPRWQGSIIPLQLSPSIREISQKARNRSSSHVDWTKLP